ncbi:MAG: response regulator, partial [Gemmatimonadetes bacterium]|nr:response regulator [Gemmatimonadota bacterium]
AGHQVVTAADAELAVRAAREHVPDVVILDLGIPAGGGFAAAERIRALNATAHVPIIVITGSEDFRCRLEAAELGVSGYLSKPFDSAQLLKILDVCTETSR